MKASLVVTLMVFEAMEMIANPIERSAPKIGNSAIEYYRAYSAAAVTNGILAYLPSRYDSMAPWAWQRVQNTPNVVAAYLPNQYASPESKPWALPPRFHDTPNVVAAYLPTAPSGIPWRLPLQTSAPCATITSKFLRANC
jgi:hypothetical protein